MSEYPRRPLKGYVPDDRRTVRRQELFLLDCKVSLLAALVAELTHNRGKDKESCLLLLLSTGLQRASFSVNDSLLLVPL